MFGITGLRVLALSAMCALAACSGTSLPEAPVTRPMPDHVELSASPRDLDPAVRFAASRNQMAVLVAHDTGPRTRTFEMITIRDEPASLEVTWPHPVRISLADAEPRDVLVSIKVGPFGNARAEWAFIRTLEARLKALMENDGTAPRPES